MRSRLFRMRHRRSSVFDHQQPGAANDYTFGRNDNTVGGNGNVRHEPLLLLNSHNLGAARWGSTSFLTKPHCRAAARKLIERVQCNLWQECCSGTFLGTKS